MPISNSPCRDLCLGGALPFPLVGRGRSSAELSAEVLDIEGNNEAHSSCFFMFDATPEPVGKPNVVPNRWCCLQSISVRRLETHTNRRRPTRSMTKTGRHANQ